MITERKLRRIVGMSFLASTILMLGAWIGLMTSFDYPEILRKSAATVLARFQEGGNGLILLWTLMCTATALLTVSILLLHRVLDKDKSTAMFMGTTFGVVSGLASLVGLIRWVFVVPVLAETWTQSAPDSPLRAAAEVGFSVVNQYGGVAIGETLGYLFVGLWLVFIGIVILKTRTFHRASGIVAIVSGAGIMSGILEHAGLTWATQVNAYAYMLMFVLFLYFGFRLLFSRESAQNEAHATASEPGTV